MNTNKFEMCSVAALQPFIRCLINRNIAPGHHLERQMIPPQMVKEGKGHIFKQQAWNFFKDVERREGLSEFGFLDGDPYSIIDLGSIGTTLQEAVTLKDAIDSFANFIWKFAEGNIIKLHQHSDMSWLLCYTKNQDRTVHAADQHTILLLRQIIRLAAGSDWQPEKVMYLSTPMIPFQSMEELSSVESHFLQDGAGVAFDSKLLSMPVEQDEDHGHNDGHVSDIATPPATTSSAVRTVMHTWLRTSRIPTFDELTEILGTSRMTLYRTLAKEDTSYRRIVERSRFIFAKELLADSSLNLKEISHRLGYSAPSNFSRAFTQISGVTPATFREKLIMSS